MFERRSLRLPITLGVLMIVTVVVLIVGWVLILVAGAVKADTNEAALYWTLLPLGTVSLVLIPHRRLWFI